MLNADITSKKACIVYTSYVLQYKPVYNMCVRYVSKKVMLEKHHPLALDPTTIQHTAVD